MTRETPGRPADKWPAWSLRLVFLVFYILCSIPAGHSPALGTGIEDRLSKAFDLVKQGRYGAAKDAYLQILEDEPGNAEALFRMGVLVYREKDFAGAVRYFEKATEADPKRQDAWRRLADAYAKLGRNEEAAEAFHRAHEIRYQRDLEIKEGVALIAAGKLGKARGIFESLVLADPGDYHAVYYYGNVLIRQGERAHAARCYQAAIKLRPVLVEAYVNLAAIRFQDGRYQEAVRLLEKTLEVVPKSAPFDPTIRYNLGLAAMKAGDAGKARENFQRYLELCPRCADADRVKGILDRLGAGKGEKDKGEEQG